MLMENKVTTLEELQALSDKINRWNPTYEEEDSDFISESSCNRFGLLLAPHHKALRALLESAISKMETTTKEVDEIIEGLSEAVEEITLGGYGYWSPCSGCHQTDEGHSLGRYSKALGSHLGIGCCECGGIGAVWNTTPKETTTEQSSGVDDNGLKPCPLDGGEIEHHTDTAFYYGDRGYRQKSEDFTCKKCGLKLCVSGDNVTKDQAFAQWNTRTEQPAVDDWRTDTPPKDGSRIIVADGIAVDSEGIETELGAAVAFWHSDDETFMLCTFSVTQSFDVKSFSKWKPLERTLTKREGV
ncbi:hypothetical protein [Caudoviricetes sp.]|nr:hypothetical protein [Caudoviricetes sp.]